MGGLGSIILLCAVIYIIYILIKRRGNFPYNKGVKLINAKNYADGLTMLEKAVEIGVSPSQEIGAAYAEVKFGDIKKAEKKINMVLLNQKVPVNMKNESRYVLAIINIAKKDFKTAREIMDKMYDTFKTTKFYSTYGYLAIMSGDPEFAKKINEEAYDYNSDNDVICDNYGLYLYNAGEYEKAGEIYEKLTDHELKFPEGYYNYANVLVKLGDNEKAKEMLEKALTIEYFGVTTVKKEEVEALYNSIK